MTLAEAVLQFALVAGLLTVIPGLDTTLVLRSRLARARAYGWPPPRLRQMCNIGGEPLLAEGSATLTGLGISAIVALLVAMRLRPPLPPLPPDLLRPSVPPLLGAGLAARVSDEYYSTHWLATFAQDAMESIEGGVRAS